MCMGSHRKFIKASDEAERKALADRWVAVYKKLMSSGELKGMSVKHDFLVKVEKKFGLDS